MSSKRIPRQSWLSLEPFHPKSRLEAQGLRETRYGGRPSGHQSLNCMGDCWHTHFPGRCSPFDRAGSVSSPEALEARRPLARLLPRVLSPQGCRKAKPLKIWSRPWALVWRWLWSRMLEECIDLCPSLSSPRWLSLMNIPPSSCFPYSPPPTPMY